MKKSKPTFSYNIIYYFFLAKIWGNNNFQYNLYFAVYLFSPIYALDSFKHYRSVLLAVLQPTQWFCFRPEKLITSTAGNTPLDITTFEWQRDRSLSGSSFVILLLPVCTKPKETLSESIVVGDMLGFIYILIILQKNGSELNHWWNWASLSFSVT